MQTEGRLISISSTKSGTKDDGTTWKRCELVVEQNTRNKDKIVLTAWGQVVDDVAHKENNEVEVDFYINAREYKGNWYNQCTVRQIKFPALYNDITEEPNMNQEANEVPAPPEADSLPF